MRVVVRSGVHRTDAGRRRRMLGDAQVRMRPTPEGWCPTSKERTHIMALRVIDTGAHSDTAMLAGRERTLRMVLFENQGKCGTAHESLLRICENRIPADRVRAEQCNERLSPLRSPRLSCIRKDIASC